MTFANTPPGHSLIGESHVDIRQYTPWTLANWRKSCGHSPVHPQDIRQLAKVPFTLDNSSKEF
jgi:hypothetical protein